MSYSVSFGGLYCLISLSSQFSFLFLSLPQRTANFVSPNNEIVLIEPTFGLEQYKNRKAESWMMQIRINVHIDWQ